MVKDFKKTCESCYLKLCGKLLRPEFNNILQERLWVCVFHVTTNPETLYISSGSIWGQLGNVSMSVGKYIWVEVLGREFSAETVFIIIFFFTLIQG